MGKFPHRHNPTAVILLKIVIKRHQRLPPWSNSITASIREGTSALPLDQDVQTHIPGHTTRSHALKSKQPGRTLSTPSASASDPSGGRWRKRKRGGEKSKKQERGGEEIASISECYDRRLRKTTILATRLFILISYI